MSRDGREHREDTWRTNTNSNLKMLINLGGGGCGVTWKTDLDELMDRLTDGFVGGFFGGLGMFRFGLCLLAMSLSN